MQVIEDSKYAMVPISSMLMRVVYIQPSGDEKRQALRSVTNNRLMIPICVHLFIFLAPPSPPTTTTPIGKLSI